MALPARNGCFDIPRELRDLIYHTMLAPYRHKNPPKATSESYGVYPISSSPESCAKDFEQFKAL
ncbi:hypothetical protein CERZMDRAFT_92424 [Cercospora zeae-maydis SCOH1-5]|uniref:Uncharacterized protein n=1 Tax=Cercospora zeae-maydis SCOH1-5 TaxID=717836 RepID=A0A6A6FWN2_9PEZI|nr:hypothetical protein CERZMDRAFT_92424 [Cercospora zeae-maydis SCOH1-5]